MRVHVLAVLTAFTVLSVLRRLTDAGEYQTLQVTTE